MTLPLSFYRNPDVVAVAKGLLGKALFTKIDGVLTGGIILETESYAGISDRASHAYNNRRTKRTEVMYQRGGVAYIYLCYGIHYLLNIVTAEKENPCAVLIRAMQPICGFEAMLMRRKKKTLVTKGPGALTQALGITFKQNGLPLNSDLLWIAEGNRNIAPEEILVSARIGVSYAGPDALLPYRFRMLAK